MKLTLPIFFVTKNVAELASIGIDSTLESNMTRPMIFYTINAIGSYIEPITNNKYTIIYSNNQEFICDITVDKVEKLIDRLNERN